MQTLLIDELSAIMYLWSLESLPVALLFDCGLRCDIPYFLKSPVCSVLFEKLFKSRNWSDCSCIMCRHIKSDKRLLIGDYMSLLTSSYYVKLHYISVFSECWKYRWSLQNSQYKGVRSSFWVTNYLLTNLSWLIKDWETFLEITTSL